MRPQKRKKICPECGKPGFLTRRWLRSSRYPKYASIDCTLLEDTEKLLAENPDNEYFQARLSMLREKVRGYRYSELEAKEFIDKQAVYRVGSRKYWHYYIGHYDSNKYQIQMKDYKSGKRKSRPNGRGWCKLRRSSYMMAYQNGRGWYIKPIYRRPLKA